VKILVVSDTHSNSSEALRVIQSHGYFQMFFHLGDTYQDAVAIRDLSGLPMRAVSGNMDPVRNGPETEIFDVGNHRVLLTHGDRFGVNRDFMGLSLVAQEANAQIICFGHTHRPCYVSLDGRYFLNPGSLRGRGGTYGVLDLSEQGVHFEIMRVGE